ncbi:MAG: hypothetical protein R3282_01260, partial [Rhodothermales bacterium]|nr:hypothetical protein [Rhodothermales bacterium]
FWSTIDSFPRAVLLGVVRPTGKTFRPILNPAPDFTLKSEDRIVLIADTYEDSLPDLKGGKATAQRAPEQPWIPIELAPVDTQPLRRLLLLGWSHKVAALVDELSGYPSERFEVEVFSLVPAEERREQLKYAPSADEGVTVTHTEGDYIRQAELAAIDWSRYDNCVFLGSDWLDSSEETDARSILGYSALRAALEGHAQRPEILVELIDPSNAYLFKRRPGEVIISPVVLSHMLAHAALRPELTSVFAELFGPGGAEIFFRPASDYQLTGRTVSFREIRGTSHACGEIAIGMRLGDQRDRPGGGLELNPPPDRQWEVTAMDEIVVLTRYS